MAAQRIFNVALCDSLQAEYCRYKHGEEFDRYRINRVLRYSEGKIITNVDQLRRIGREDELRSQEKVLRAAGLKGQTDVADLAGKTVLHIVLSDTRNDFPYVNILDPQEPLQPVIGGCFFRDQPRDKAVRHITSLCSKASEILIYDKYLAAADNIERNMRMLASILPDRNIKLIYHADQIVDDAKNLLTSLRPKLSLTPGSLPTHHDRYIVLDRAIEIILTSGFYHLGSTIKEMTYIVRQCATPRFR